MHAGLPSKTFGLRAHASRMDERPIILAIQREGLNPHQADA